MTKLKQSLSTHKTSLKAHKLKIDIKIVYIYKIPAIFSVKLRFQVCLIGGPVYVLSNQTGL